MSSLIGVDGVNFKLLLICLRTTWFLHLNNVWKLPLCRFQILLTNQSSFWSRYVSGTTLLSLKDEILRAIDKVKLAILIHLNYSKRFHSLNYKLLISILYYIDLRDDAIKLFSNYLSLTNQTVKWIEKMSQSLLVLSSFPQGTYLGHLFYIVYITFKGHLIFVNFTCMQTCPKYKT